jgi:hypothetical protein
VKKGLKLFGKKNILFTDREYAVFAPCATQNRCGIHKGKKAKEGLVK